MRQKAPRPVARRQLAGRRIRSLAAMTVCLAIFSLVVRYLDDNLYGSSRFSGWFLTGAVVILAAFHWRKKVPVLAGLG
jgi:hypothetical protein